ncbi:MAG: terpene cyclase/mutase family protein [Kiritimatiellia bacterium]|jgi:hypothetical protein|nr:terpene cyclase/mutase family protein [Kiritimatiellia bacterium]
MRNGRPAGPGTLLLLALLALPVFVPLSHAERASNVLTPFQAEVDAAVEKGLHFLAGKQKENGSFEGGKGDVTAIVSLAGMAFLAKGHTPGYGPYGKHINRCIDYLISQQQPNGMLVHRHGNHGGMYSHNISTLFLSEVCGMLDPPREKRLAKALGKAVRLIISAQQVPKDDNHRGGWRYKHDSRDSDLSCSGWAVMALRSARLNGAPVPDESIEEGVAYIMRRCDEARGTFGYQDRNGHAVTLTGAALLCLELTGSHGKDLTFNAGDYILNSMKQLPGQGHAYYGNYYNAQAMFQLGGKYWEKYAEWMYNQWLEKQHEDGSWRHGGHGETYSTAMMLLAFTVPYRQLPIYQRDETVDEEK